MCLSTNVGIHLFSSPDQWGPTFLTSSRYLQHFRLGYLGYLSCCSWWLELFRCRSRWNQRRSRLELRCCPSWHQLHCLGSSRHLDRSCICQQGRCWSLGCCWCCCPPRLNDVPTIRFLRLMRVWSGLARAVKDCSSMHNGRGFWCRRFPARIWVYGY